MIKITNGAGLIRQHCALGSSPQGPPEARMTRDKLSDKNAASQSLSTAWSDAHQATRMGLGRPHIIRFVHRCVAAKNVDEY